MIFFSENIHITTRKLSYFLLCLLKVNQKYSDGQNDPERFHISSTFPMAGLVLLQAVSQTPDYGCHHTAPFGVNGNEYKNASMNCFFLKGVFFFFSFLFTYY